MGSLENFGEILKKVDKTQVSRDFWKNEKKSFKKIEEETKELTKELTMTFDKYHQCFTI